MFRVQDIFFLSENVPVRFYPTVADPDPPGFQFFRPLVCNEKFCHKVYDNFKTLGLFY